jgi:hypothetical protein
MMVMGRVGYVCADAFTVRMPMARTPTANIIVRK